ncbi:MAG: hypothetical protein HC828_14915 [Blastochloris sp.]|nr:hypothetical protein [Blastochloris sp.]
MARGAPFGDVEREAGSAGSSVALPAPATAGVLHLAGATEDGLWHTVRFSNGAWQPFGDVTARIGRPGNGEVRSVALAGR